jgi:hypothetical protein
VVAPTAASFAFSKISSADNNPAIVPYSFVTRLPDVYCLWAI